MFLRRIPVLVLTLCLLLTLAVPAEAAHSLIRVVVNGVDANIYAPPLLVSGRLMVPAYQVDKIVPARWDPVSQILTTANKQGDPVSLRAGIVMVAGQPVALDVPPTLVGAQLYLPLRFLVEGAGGQIAWDAPHQQALVTLRRTVALKGGSPERAAAWLEAHRSDPNAMQLFLRRLPKGGDLHNHLSGAIFAESFIAWAVADGLCVDRTTYTFGDCGPGWDRVVNVLADPAAYQALVRALSMADFTPGWESGHDHFFATFGKFGRVSGAHSADMLAETAARAAAENVDYLELMLSLDGGKADEIAALIQWDGNLENAYQRIDKATNQAVVAATAVLNDTEQAMRAKLRCTDARSADPGCQVQVRYVNQASRTKSNAAVFTQFVIGLKLQQSDPRVVGQNLVQPEDNASALANYDDQMWMLNWLAKKFPAAHVSLHAGELTPTFVSAASLCCHIRKAVEIAHAQRIGHGVDIQWEQDPAGLLAEMAQQQVAVEINLTSNDQILSVSGLAHPLPLYLAAGVPVVLSTDDPGVERIDLTHEYQRAAATYGLTYLQLKAISRNSLTFSFLPGAGLWAGPVLQTPVAACAGDTLGAATPSAACQSFLAGSEKARAQWQLEAKLAAFEAGF